MEGHYDPWRGRDRVGRAGQTVIRLVNPVAATRCHSHRFPLFICVFLKPPPHSLFCDVHCISVAAI